MFKLVNVLCLVTFLFTSISAPLVEANFWQERRQHIIKKRPKQLAGLPAAVNPSSALRHLPALNKSPLNLYANHSIDKKIPSILPQNLKSFIGSLPYAYGNIRHISLPQDQSPKRLVLMIQDIHANPEAQKNISSIIHHLISSHPSLLIALEGAFKKIDLSGFQSLPEKDVMKQVSDYLLKENKISGPIHAGLTYVNTETKNHTPHTQFVGVDHKKHYTANVKAYTEAQKTMPVVSKLLSNFQQQTNQQKQDTFNPVLKSFDDKAQAYHKRQLSLGKYTKILNKAASLSAFPHLTSLLKAYTIESSLNFNEVHKQRELLIKTLIKKLNQTHITNLINHSTAYRLGKINHTDFYVYLQKLCRTNHIKLSQYQAMDLYLKYVMLSDSIKPENLFNEIKKAENTVYASLYQNPKEKKLVLKSKKLSLIKKLIDFSLTTDEWEEYKKQTKDQRLKTIDHNHRPQDLAVTNAYDAQRMTIPDLSSFENFYKHAEARDKAMADNLVKKVGLGSDQLPITNNQLPNLSVLVAGGFHASGLIKQLNNAGIGVVSFAPKITRIDTEKGASYLSVFTQEKTPLEELFQGDKLFLSPIQIPPRTQNTAAALYCLRVKLKHTKTHVQQLLRIHFPRLANTIKIKIQAMTPDGLKAKIQNLATKLSTLITLSQNNNELQVKQTLIKPGLRDRLQRQIAKLKHLRFQKPWTRSIVIGHVPDMLMHTGPFNNIPITIPDKSSFRSPLYFETMDTTGFNTTPNLTEEQIRIIMEDVKKKFKGTNCNTQATVMFHRLKEKGIRAHIYSDPLHSHYWVEAAGYILDTYPPRFPDPSQQLKNNLKRNNGMILINKRIGPIPQDYLSKIDQTQSLIGRDNHKQIISIPSTPHSHSSSPSPLFMETLKKARHFAPVHSDPDKLSIHDHMAQSGHTAAYWRFSHSFGPAEAKDAAQQFAEAKYMVSQIIDNLNNDIFTKEGVQYAPTSQQLIQHIYSYLNNILSRQIMTGLFTHLEEIQDSKIPPSDMLSHIIKLIGYTHKLIRTTMHSLKTQGKPSHDSQLFLKRALKLLADMSAFCTNTPQKKNKDWRYFRDTLSQLTKDLSQGVPFYLSTPDTMISDYDRNRLRLLTQFKKLTSLIDTLLQHQKSSRSQTPASASVKPNMIFYYLFGGSTKKGLAGLLFIEIPTLVFAGWLMNPMIMSLLLGLFTLWHMRLHDKMFPDAQRAPPASGFTTFLKRFAFFLPYVFTSELANLHPLLILVPIIVHATYDWYQMKWPLLLALRNKSTKYLDAHTEKKYFIPAPVSGGLAAVILTNAFNLPWLYSAPLITAISLLSLWIFSWERFKNLRGHQQRMAVDLKYKFWFPIKFSALGFISLIPILALTALTQDPILIATLSFTAVLAGLTFKTIFHLIHNKFQDRHALSGSPISTSLGEILLSIIEADDDKSMNQACQALHDYLQDANESDLQALQTIPPDEPADTRKRIIPMEDKSIVTLSLTSETMEISHSGEDIPSVVWSLSERLHPGLALLKQTLEESDTSKSNIKTFSSPRDASDPPDRQALLTLLSSLDPDTDFSNILPALDPSADEEHDPIAKAIKKTSNHILNASIFYQILSDYHTIHSLRNINTEALLLKAIAAIEELTVQNENLSSTNINTETAEELHAIILTTQDHIHQILDSLPNITQKNQKLFLEVFDAQLRQTLVQIQKLLQILETFSTPTQTPHPMLSSDTLSEKIKRLLIGMAKAKNKPPKMSELDSELYEALTHYEEQDGDIRIILTKMGIMIEDNKIKTTAVPPEAYDIFENPEIERYTGLLYFKNMILDYSAPLINLANVLPRIRKAPQNIDQPDLKTRVEQIISIALSKTEFDNVVLLSARGKDRPQGKEAIELLMKEGHQTPLIWEKFGLTSQEAGEAVEIFNIHLEGVRTSVAQFQKNTFCNSFHHYEPTNIQLARLLRISIETDIPLSVHQQIIDFALQALEIPLYTNSINEEIQAQIEFTKQRLSGITDSSAVSPLLNELNTLFEILPDLCTHSPSPDTLLKATALFSPFADSSNFFRKVLAESISKNNDQEILAHDLDQQLYRLNGHLNQIMALLNLLLEIPSARINLAKTLRNISGIQAGNSHNKITQLTEFDKTLMGILQECDETHIPNNTLFFNVRESFSDISCVLKTNDSNISIKVPKNRNNHIWLETTENTGFIKIQLQPNIDYPGINRLREIIIHLYESQNQPEDLYTPIMSPLWNIFYQPALSSAKNNDTFNWLPDFVVYFAGFCEEFILRSLMQGFLIPMFALAVFGQSNPWFNMISYAFVFATFIHPAVFQFSKSNTPVPATWRHRLFLFVMAMGLGMIGHFFGASPAVLGFIHGAYNIVIKHRGVQKAKTMQMARAIVLSSVIQPGIQSKHISAREKEKLLDLQAQIVSDLLGAVQKTGIEAPLSALYEEPSFIEEKQLLEAIEQMLNDTPVSSAILQARPMVHSLTQQGMRAQPNDITTLMQSTDFSQPGLDLMIIDSKESIKEWDAFVDFLKRYDVSNRNYLILTQDEKLMNTQGLAMRNLSQAFTKTAKGLFSFSMTQLRDKDFINTQNICIYNTPYVTLDTTGLHANAPLRLAAKQAKIITSLLEVIESRLIRLQRLHQLAIKIAQFA